MLAHCSLRQLVSQNGYVGLPSTRRQTPVLCFLQALPQKLCLLRWNQLPIKTDGLMKTQVLFKSGGKTGVCPMRFPKYP